MWIFFKCLQKLFLGGVEESDIKSLCSNILKTSTNGAALRDNEEVNQLFLFTSSFFCWLVSWAVICSRVQPSSSFSLSPKEKEFNFLVQVTKWLAFAEEFPASSEACVDALQKLNEDLATKSVLLGNGLKPSATDVIVFSVVYSYVVHVSLFGIFVQWICLYSIGKKREEVSFSLIYLTCEVKMFLMLSSIRLAFQQWTLSSFLIFWDGWIISR